VRKDNTLSNSSSASIVTLKNQIATVRSQIIDLMVPGSVHANNSRAVSECRTRLAALEDQLVTAQYLSAPAPAPVQQKRNHKMNAAQLRDLFHGVRVEVRDLLTSTTGLTTPQAYQDWTAATKFVGPLVGLVTRYDRVGKPNYVKTSVIDDTATTMSFVAEAGSTSATEADPSSINVEIVASDVILSKLRYSIQLEQDAFEFQKFLTTVAAARVARGLNYVLTTGKDQGTGTALPNNISGGLLSSAAVAGTVSTGAGSIGYSDLMTLKSACDSSFRQNAVYMVSQALHDIMEAQKDSTSRPYYEHDNEGYLLVAGQRCYTNSAMVFSSGQPAVLYGDFSRAVGFLDGGSSAMIIKEAPGLIENMKHELLIWSRIGSAPLLTNSVKQLIAE
jgi:HK97 family phage major capsid protein